MPIRVQSLGRTAHGKRLLFARWRPGLTRSVQGCVTNVEPTTTEEYNQIGQCACGDSPVAQMLTCGNCLGEAQAATGERCLYTRIVKPRELTTPRLYYQTSKTSARKLSLAVPPFSRVRRWARAPLEAARPPRSPLQLHQQRKTSTLLTGTLKTLVKKQPRRRHLSTPRPALLLLHRRQSRARARL